MKKIIVSSLLAASVMFGADATVCPDLSVKTTNEDITKGMEIGLTSLPVISITVSDVLRNYNNTTDTHMYLNEENLKEMGATVVFNELSRLKYESYEYNNDIEGKQKLEKEYERLIKTITPENKNWCNETINREANNIINAGIKTRMNNAELELKEMRTLHDSFIEGAATINLKDIKRCPNSTSIQVINNTQKSQLDTLKSSNYILDEKTNKLSVIKDYGKFTTIHKTTLDVCRNSNQQLEIKIKDIKKDSIE